MIEITYIYILVFVILSITLFALIIYYRFYRRLLNSDQQIKRRLDELQSSNEQINIKTDRKLNDKYSVGYELGRGMNAVTFQVEDIANPNKRLVAKVLLTPEDEPRIDASSYRRHLQRFIQEMQNLKKLKESDYVVPIYSFHNNSLPPFYVMEYCDGSLADYILNPPLEMHEVQDILVDICNGLFDVHKLHIRHRDLKPANILNYKNKWVLADFGMSLLGGDRDVDAATGSLIGTIPYTAPEVLYFGPERLTNTADIFSLGIVIKEMLTGVNSLEGKTSTHLKRGVSEDTYQEIKLFDDLVEKMTNTSPNERQQSIQGIALQLYQIFEDIQINRDYNRLPTNNLSKEKNERLKNIVGTL